MAKSRTEHTPAELRQMTSLELAQLMTEKQMAFAHAYVLERNGTKAAIAAGYRPGKNNHAAAVAASRLLADPVIKAYRLALQREAFDRIDISLESLCADLVEIKERCMTAKPVMAWDHEAHEMRETGEWVFDAKGATAAIVRLAELLGLEAKKEDAGGRIVIEGMK